MKRRPPPIVAIFLTVFIDLLGFGLTVPDIQLRALYLGAHHWQIGAIQALYSLAQLLGAPLLGRLSDRVGRRRVLMVSTVLACLGHAVYAHADALWIMAVARLLAGLASANIGVAMAYMSDVSAPADRPKVMGLLGAAFGLGFVLGPPIGAMLVSLGHGHPIALGSTGLALSALNLVFIAVALPEMRPKAQDGRRRGVLWEMVRALGTPGLGYLLVLFFVYNLAFTSQQSTFFLLIEGQFGRTPDAARHIGSVCLMVVGMVSLLMQGFLIRKLAPMLGETKMLRWGYLLLAPVLILMPFSPPMLPLLLVIVFMGVGAGLANPSLNSLVSHAAPKDLRGGIFGISQSVGALARILSPMVALPLFRWHAWVPYVGAGVLMLVPLAGAVVGGLERYDSHKAQHFDENAAEPATVS